MRGTSESQVVEHAQDVPTLCTNPLKSWRCPKKFISAKYSTSIIVRHILAVPVTRWLLQVALGNSHRHPLWPSISIPSTQTQEQANAAMRRLWHCIKAAPKLHEGIPWHAHRLTQTLLKASMRCLFSRTHWQSQHHTISTQKHCIPNVWQLSFNQLSFEPRSMKRAHDEPLGISVWKNKKQNTHTHTPKIAYPNRMAQRT